MFDSLGSTLIGLAAGAIGFILTKHLDRWFFSPRVRIVFDDDDGNRVDYSDFNDRNMLTESIYHRLKLTNDSTTVARDCRVYLTNLEVNPGDGFMRTSFRDSVRLQWAHEKADELEGKVHLPKGVGMYFDIAYQTNEHPEYMEKVDSFTPRIVNKALRSENSMHRHVPYRFTIIATADNAEPYVAKVVVGRRREGGWIKILSLEGNSMSVLRQALDSVDKELKRGRME